MKRTGIKWTATALCSVSVLVLCTSVGNAGLIPWAWNALFGPYYPQSRCATPAYRGACAPSASAPSFLGSSSFGVQNAFFTPAAACSPWGSSVCSTQGSQCGTWGSVGTPAGQCGVTTPATPTRTPEPEKRRTYDDQGAGSSADEGWNTTPGEKTGNDTPIPGEELDEVKANKLPAETAVPGKNGAAQTPVDIDSGAGGPAFNLDGKVTWRPAIGRTRFARRATYASARLIRKPRHAKGQWIAVPSPAHVANR